MPPLSYETERRVAALFQGESREQAAELLVEECGDNLASCGEYGSIALERLRFAALKVSGGSLVRLKEAVELAKLDWRDLLMASGFAENPDAHKRWFPHGRDYSRS